MEQCNQIGQQGYTACGVDSLMVLCTFNPEDGSKCLHDFGPCAVGMAQGGSIGQCVGRTQYAAHLPDEKHTRRSRHYEQARSALSLAVAALCEMTYARNDETRRREEIFLKTLEEIRGVAGDIRLTTMAVECAWCDPPRILGEKEGNGATGVTSTICPECAAKQLAQTVPEEVRRVAESVISALGSKPDDLEARQVREQMEHYYQKEEPTPPKVTAETIAEFRKTLGNALLERGNPAEVAASTGLI